MKEENFFQSLIDFITSPDINDEVAIRCGAVTHPDDRLFSMLKKEFSRPRRLKDVGIEESSPDKSTWNPCFEIAEPKTVKPEFDIKSFKFKNKSPE